MRQRLYRVLIIRNGVIAQIAIAETIEVVTAQGRRATGLNINHNKAHLGQTLIAGIVKREASGNLIILWTGINKRDNGIFLRLVKMSGQIHHSVKRGLSVCSRHINQHRRLPTGGL